MGDVVAGAGPAQRDERVDELVPGVAAADVVHPRRVDDAGADGVDPHAVAPTSLAMHAVSACSPAFDAA